LADILVRIGELGLAYPQIKEIDVNPLIVNKGLPVAVDATIIIDDW
jgi:acetyltransferase